jgi:hypothetical protein
VPSSGCSRVCVYAWEGGELAYGKTPTSIWATGLPGSQAAGGVMKLRGRDVYVYIQPCVWGGGMLISIKEAATSHKA